MSTSQLRRKYHEAVIDYGVAYEHLARFPRDKMKLSLGQSRRQSMWVARRNDALSRIDAVIDELIESVA